jgi:ABC-2 type transport system permease protein
MEVFKNRLVIFTVAFLPLLLTAIPLVILYSLHGTVSASVGSVSNQLPSELTAGVCTSGTSSSECLQLYLASQFMILFMIVPVAIPGAIAAYSIVGEKTTHSLEPLLATPITTTELLLGKCLAAVVPAVLATFASYAIFVLGAWIITASDALFRLVFMPHWLIAILIVGPLLAVLAVTFAMMVSSRVNDPRVAEQVSVVVIIPVLAGFVGQISGLFVLNEQIVIVFALILAALDAFMLYVATQTFQRETILTRWR